MASFRTGFKIFGEISIKQGLGRIRSFSEDRKPRQWLPEDQWAVRQPGSTCPEGNKPKKQPKPSKSWLSVCRGPPEPPIDCDIRHNNCPPPAPIKDEGPWYSLDNLLPKKKPEKPVPSPKSCREEMKRREYCEEENEVDKHFVQDDEPEISKACIPRPEPCLAPVITLSAPLPKELDLMLWCGMPCKETARIANSCQSDKLPYEEFRPQKTWKPSPYCLPTKAEPPTFKYLYPNKGLANYSEFKQVEVPKPLYTRYKSVELSDSKYLFTMTYAKCPDVESLGLAINTPAPNVPCTSSVEEDEKPKICQEKPFLEGSSVTAVRLKRAPKYSFRPKSAKLIEKRVYRSPYHSKHKVVLAPLNPLSKCENCGDKASDQKAGKPPEINPCEIPKIGEAKCELAKLRSSKQQQTPEPTSSGPATFDRSLASQAAVPQWMTIFTKPKADESKQEKKGDHSKPYGGECAPRKPPPELCAAIPKLPDPEFKPIQKPPCPECKDRFVLMPKQYNIKNTKAEASKDDCASSFQSFIESKTSSPCKYPPMKENILYDLQRMCPNIPFAPTKHKTPCRKPPEPDCPQPPRFYRSFSTFSPSALRKLNSLQLANGYIQRRTDCGDSSEKCKIRKSLFKERECTEKTEIDCAEISLPCCPKARLPPSCLVRKPHVPCKKRLAPKPAFSECSRDPFPCPKITECNCWDKKPGNGRNGKNGGR